MKSAPALAARRRCAMPFLNNATLMLAVAIIVSNIATVATSSAQAPQAKVRVIARVVDAEGNKPIKSASLYMKHLGDGSVTGDIADTEGKFSVNNAKVGRYYVAVTYLGFAKYKDTVSIEAGKSQVDLGTIILRQAAAVLVEIAVSAERETMEITPEKKVFNVEKNATVTGGTAADVLRQVPTVDVDVNGNISVRGSSNLVIQINGKQTGFSGSDRAALLQQIPANLVDKIEVITNPSARYDAEGMGGIINIVTKAEITQSWNLTLTGGVGTNSKYNASADLGYKNGPLSLTAGYGARFHHQYFGADLNASYLTGNQERFAQGLYGTWTGMGHFANLNADYVLNDNITLNLNAQGRLNDGGNREALSFDYMRSSGESYRRAARDNNTARSWKSGEIGGGYKQTFSSKQHYLDVSTRYTANRATSLAHSVEREQDLLGMPLLGLPAEMNNNFYNTFRIWIAQADYVQPTAIGKLETGVKSTLRLIDNDTYLDSLNRRTGEYVPNVGAINSFFFSDHVLAGYGMLSTKLMDFNVQAGVRVEHTIVRTEQLTTGERSGTAYTHLFPTLHLSRKLDTANTLQFSYSRRINRPNFWQLNPFVDYSNPALLRKGNPQLLPETIDAVEASWVTQLDKHTLTATGYYRRTTDAMQFYAVVDPSIPPSAGNTLLTFRNFDAVQNMGFEGVYRGQVLPGWTLIGNVNVFYNSIQGGSEVGNISAGRVTYNFRAMSALKMPWEGGNLQVNYMYNGPMVISQGTMDAWHALTLGFRQDVSKELSLTFNVSDVVNTQAFVLRLGDANFHSLVNQKPETRIATLNITYRLGGIQGEQPRRRRDAGDAPQESGGVGFGF